VQALRNRDDASLDAGLAQLRLARAVGRSEATRQRESQGKRSAGRDFLSTPSLTRFVNRTEELCDSRRSSLERERGDGASGEAASRQCRLAPALELRRSTWGGQEVPTPERLPLRLI